MSATRHHYIHRLRHRLPSLKRRQRAEPLPIVLGRKRIYILPTGFGIGFAAIVLVMLVGALNYTNNAALLTTCLLGAAVSGSLLTTFRDMNGLRLDAVRAGNAHAGEPIRIQLDFAVAERTRNALRVDIDAQTLPFGIPASAGYTLEMYLPTTQRGWMPLPRLRVYSTWPFGLFRAWSWLAPEQPVLVYPQAEAQGPLPPGGDAAGQARNQRQRHAGDDLASLRAYRAGDAIKLVAWKASARHEGLLVREFEQPASHREWSLDWHDVADLEHEAGIARLARWVEAAHAAGAHWSLRLPDTHLGPDSGSAHYHQCMRALALMP
ncbi:MAG TPA: DUF58 domain-containing protein [Oleiagrimonas sp.]|nr:DUF58 domain-containing protein [Oleiagrimonas sp.]